MSATSAAPAATSASARLFERTRAALDAVGLDAAANEDLHTFRTLAGGDHGAPDVATIIVVMAGADAVGCYAVWPAFVPEASRAEMAELVTRGNNLLVWSCLELDLDGGGLSARVTVPTGRLDDAAVLLLGSQLADAVAEANRVLAVHRPAVDAVLGGTPAAEAIGLVLLD